MSSSYSLDYWMERAVTLALEEDLSWGDLTTEACVPPGLWALGKVISRSEGVVAGLPVAERVFQKIDPSLKTYRLVEEGDRIQPGQILLEIEGSARSILAGERTCLNFLQHLSGIATRTAQCVEKVKGTKARIVDTRKTLPGLRFLEKYAVRVGGGSNHRSHLGDGILIKDNHIAVAGSITRAVAQARARAPHTLKIEVEVANLDQLEEALKAGADAILLDNMNLAELRFAVNRVAGKALLEASGGITEDNLRAVAETGVDLISIGALTHSAPALDLSLEISPLPKPL